MILSVMLAVYIIISVLILQDQEKYREAEYYLQMAVNVT